MFDRDKINQPFWHGKFRGCGYRMTLGREVILDVLSNSDSHLSAEDIYMKVHPLYPNIGLTTIYRTLDILSNLGMVFKFDFGDGRARYELVEEQREGNHHHHLVCTNCKRIINYNDFMDEEVELIKKMEDALSKRHGFVINNHVIQFYGLCAKCREK